MSIADKITALQTAKSNIASAITNKGGTVASGDGFSNFASDIATIPSGITPSGSQTFTENGTYDVTAIAEAIVNVSGGGGIDTSLPFTWGTFTPTEETNVNENNPIVINHGLSVVPTRFVLIDLETTEWTPLHAVTMCVYAVSSAGTGTPAYGIWIPSSTTATFLGYQDANPSQWSVGATSVSIGLAEPEAEYSWSGLWLMGGHTYLWMAQAEGVTPSGIACGRVVPSNDSLTVNTGITSDDVQLIFIAENDPRTAYATLSFMTNVSAFRARSYNGSLTSSDNLWTHFTPTWNNGIFTMTRVDGHNFRLSADAYYWYAIPLASSPLMLASPSPSGDDIERK